MGLNETFFAGINKYKAVIIGTNKVTMTPLRSALKSIGFQTVVPLATLTEGLLAAKVPGTTHALFDVNIADLPGEQFVREALAANPNLIIVVITENPGADNVFDLLRAGARGFLLIPPTLAGVESVLISATSGPPLSQSILQAHDRNEAFVNLALNLLFRARAFRAEMQKTPSAGDMYLRTMNAIGAAMATARMFAEGGEEQLRQKVIDVLEAKSNAPKSRLGEVRKKLHNKPAA